MSLLKNAIRYARHRKTRLLGRDCCTPLVLYHKRRCLPTVCLGGKPHGDTVPKGQILPREVKPLAALVGPDRTDACPDFLAGLVFARGLAVSEERGWSVRRTHAVRETAFSVGA